MSERRKPHTSDSTLDTLLLHLAQCPFCWSIIKSSFKKNERMQERFEVHRVGSSRLRSKGSIISFRYSDNNIDSLDCPTLQNTCWWDFDVIVVLHDYSTRSILDHGRFCGLDPGLHLTMTGRSRLTRKFFDNRTWTNCGFLWRVTIYDEKTFIACIWAYLPYGTNHANCSWCPHQIYIAAKGKL